MPVRVLKLGYVFFSDLCMMFHTAISAMTVFKRSQFTCVDGSPSSRFDSPMVHCNDWVHDLPVTPAAVRVNTTKTTSEVETSEVFHFLSQSFAEMMQFDEPIFVQVGVKTKHQRPGQVLGIS